MFFSSHKNHQQLVSGNLADVKRKLNLKGYKTVEYTIHVHNIRAHINFVKWHAFDKFVRSFEF